MSQRRYPKFRLDDFASVSWYIVNIERIARRDKTLRLPKLEDRFEDVVYAIFKMMHLNVEQRGYKKRGQEDPDGLIRIPNKLLVLYDCKTSEAPYTLSARERRKVQSHAEVVFRGLHDAEFGRMIYALIANSFDASALKSAEQLEENLELGPDGRLRFGMSVRVALVTTRGLIRLFEKSMAICMNVDALSRLRGLIDERRIEELWRHIR